MAVYSSPFGPKPQWELSDGLPAVGYRVFTYAAGSVGTKQNTYTSSTGLSANSNPITLNSLGQPGNEIWFTGGLTYKVVYAPPGSDDPPNSPVWTIDNLSGINDPAGISAVADQWIVYTGAPTFIGATSFSLVGDQTGVFHIGRRLKTTNTGGTIYSYISNSVFGAVTTVTVVNDSGTLDSGLSSVSYGILSSLNPSIPALRGVRAFTTLGVGNTAPSTSGSGISFPATQSASTDANTLDDYEEGVWSPIVGGTATYTTQDAMYIKVGRMVWVRCSLVINAIGSGATNNISGLPFTSKTTSSGNTAGMGVVSIFANSATACVFIGCYVESNSAVVKLSNLVAAAASTTNGSTAILGNGTRVDFALTYEADN